MDGDEIKASTAGFTTRATNFNGPGTTAVPTPPTSGGENEVVVVGTESSGREQPPPLVLALAIGCGAMGLVIIGLAVTVQRLRRIKDESNGAASNRVKSKEPP